MKTPRSISAAELIKKLQSLGYQITRQAGSHIRLTTNQNGHTLLFPIITRCG